MFEGLFTMGGVSYLMAFAALLAFMLLVGVVVILLNDTARQYFKKAAFPLLIVTAAIFVVVEVFILQVPSQAYQQGYSDAVGRPDAACPVFRQDGAGNLVLSEENGSAIKNEYKLVGRPVVLMADGEIHLWLSNRDIFPDGTHLCSIPLTADNAKFAEQATKAWDNLHGEPGSGEELRELREQAEQNGQQGQQGQQGQPGEGQGNGEVPDIIIELPNTQEEGDEGNQGNAEQRGERNGRNSQQNEGNQQYDQESEGSVTIRPATPPSEKPTRR